MSTPRPPLRPWKAVALGLTLTLGACGEGTLDTGFSAQAPGDADADPGFAETDAGADALDALRPTQRDAEPGADADGLDASPTAPDGGGTDPDTMEAGPTPADAGPPDPDAAPPPPPPPQGPPVYPADRDHSPLGPALVARLQQIAAAAPNRAADAFAKIGDSITVSEGFLHCFDGGAVNLDGRDALQPTLDFFRGGDAAGTSPFGRESEAAVVGWSVQSALRGAPSPVERELAAVNPRFATVMYGSNDVENDNLSFYGDHMRLLVDLLLAQGVVPILSTIPPRDDKPSSDAEVPTYNTIVRALAQARGVPLVDLHRRLLPLPGHGLGGDHLHPRSARTGACDFTAEGLQAGYNVRNLLTLEALDRARAALAGAPPPDAAPPVRLGTGTAADPIVVEALPFGDARDTHAPAQVALPSYPGCGSAADEGGGEFIYRLDLAVQTTVRADVVDGDGVDIDLHLVVDPADPGTCLQRHDRHLVADLGPGTWYFVLDTFVAAGAPQPGEYLLAIVAE
jgi:hypothetical protein